MTCTVVLLYCGCDVRVEEERNSEGGGDKTGNGRGGECKNRVALQSYCKTMTVYLY
jgi:hypothetical protein